MSLKFWGIGIVRFHFFFWGVRSGGKVGVEVVEIFVFAGTITNDHMGLPPGYIFDGNVMECDLSLFVTLHCDIFSERWDLTPSRSF